MAEKVLIVHEDAEFVARIKVALAAVASDIQVANALSAIRAEGMLAQEKPDVLVVDAGLADRDGYEFAKAVKGVAETSGVPIVMVAPVVDEVAALKARSSGAAALLPSGGGDAQLASRIVALARSGGAQAAPTAPGPAPQVMSVPSAVAAGGPVPAPAPVPVAAGPSAPVGTSPSPAPAGPSGNAPAGAVPSGPAPVAGYGAPMPVERGSVPRGLRPLRPQDPRRWEPVFRSP